MEPAARGQSDRLAAVLKAIGNPVRIELLGILRVPRAVGEIYVKPFRKEAGGAVSRWMSETAIRKHLVQLLAIQVVQHRQELVDGRKIDRYVVNHQQLFALTEEIADLTRLVPDGRTGGKDTRSDEQASTFPDSAGPRLLLVKGRPDERAFHLDPRTAEWTIGRRKGAGVWLDHDPYVSAQNCVLSRRGDRFFIRGIQGTRNGTWLNGERLPDEVELRLCHGDVLRVGHSILVFQESFKGVAARATPNSDAEP